MLIFIERGQSITRVHTRQVIHYGVFICGAVTSASKLPTVVIDEMLSKERGKLYCDRVCIQVIKTTPITKMSKGGANEGATLLYTVMQQTVGPLCTLGCTNHQVTENWLPKFTIHDIAFIEILISWYAPKTMFFQSIDITKRIGYFMNNKAP